MIIVNRVGRKIYLAVVSGEDILRKRNQEDYLRFDTRVPSPARTYDALSNAS